MAELPKSSWHSKRGISIRRLNIFIAIITLIISMFLLIATYKANNVYHKMRSHIENYNLWQQSAYDLQIASDYLTEQVRCFAETGDIQYLNNYFTEANITKRRDIAINNLKEVIGGTDAYSTIESAMNKSISLMEREFYSMRLTSEAYGYDISNLPKEIQNVKLSESDSILSKEQKEALARSIVFDKVYHDKKAEISNNVQLCISHLKDDIDTQQVAISDSFSILLDLQRFLIIASIFVSLLTMLLTLLMVISPLIRAVMYIRADEPIPIRGSNEFQFLAKTYNLMYEANKEQNEHLAFEATHDPLTRAYNRNGYDFIIKNTDWKTSAMLLFDVDNFKPINDTYGHDVGDKVLINFVEILKHNFRSQDYVCRLGGDEFAVIMVHIDSHFSELIKNKVQSINDSLKNSELDLPKVHISCGAAYGEHFKDIEDIFLKADAALYYVKNNGGCGCEIASLDG